MGARGTSEDKYSNQSNTISKEPEVQYKPFEYGQLTRYEAGVIYRANKEGNIKVLPETTRTLYKDTEDYIRFAQERYSQDHIYYDRIYSATENILKKDYKAAQKELDKWEHDMIELSGKKSSFYKYKNLK